MEVSGDVERVAFGRVDGENPVQGIRHLNRRGDRVGNQTCAVDCGVAVVAGAEGADTCHAGTDSVVAVEIKGADVSRAATARGVGRPKLERAAAVDGEHGVDVGVSVSGQADRGTPVHDDPGADVVVVEGATGGGDDSRAGVGHDVPAEGIESRERQRAGAAIDDRAGTAGVIDDRGGNGDVARATDDELASRADDNVVGGGATLDGDGGRAGIEDAVGSEVPTEGVSEGENLCRRIVGAEQIERRRSGKGSKGVGLVAVVTSGADTAVVGPLGDGGTREECGGRGRGVGGGGRSDELADTVDRGVGGGGARADGGPATNQAGGDTGQVDDVGGVGEGREIERGTRGSAQDTGVKGDGTTDIVRQRDGAATRELEGAKRLAVIGSTSAAEPKGRATRQGDRTRREENIAGRGARDVEVEVKRATLDRGVADVGGGTREAECAGASLDQRQSRAVETDGASIGRVGRGVDCQ